MFRLDVFIFFLSAVLDCLLLIFLLKFVFLSDAVCGCAHMPVPETQLSGKDRVSFSGLLSGN